MRIYIRYLDTKLQNSLHKVIETKAYFCGLRLFLYLLFCFTLFYRYFCDMKNLKQLFLISFLIVTCLSIGSCGKSFKKGQVVTISVECIGAYDEDVLDEIGRYSAQKNELMVRAIVESGQAIILSQGRGAIVEDYKFGKYQISLIDGKKVWVLSNHIE